MQHSRITPNPYRLNTEQDYNRSKLEKTIFEAFFPVPFRMVHSKTDKSGKLHLQSIQLHGKYWERESGATKDTKLKPKQYRYHNRHYFNDLQIDVLLYTYRKRLWQWTFYSLSSLWRCNRTVYRMRESTTFPGPPTGPPNLNCGLLSIFSSSFHMVVTM